jgi:hypothetical protein
MTADPVTRAARRQTLLDRLAEHLTEWGCPADLVAPRALGLLHEVESAGWLLPTSATPPLTGRGSTPEGRARALAEARAALAARRLRDAADLAQTISDDLGRTVGTHTDAHSRPALPPPSDEHPAPGTSTTAERDGVTSQTKR